MDWEQVKHRYRQGDAKQIYGMSDSPIRTKLCDYIIENFSDCKSFFEFGCSAGYNLQRIKQKLPDAKYEGIDLNIDAIIWGQRLGHNINIGDEDTLKTILDDEFDIAFTSSVMNHIPKTHFPGIMKQLKRIAGKHIICMEGNVSKEPDYFIHDWPRWGFELKENIGKGMWVEYYIWQCDK